MNRRRLILLLLVSTAFLTGSCNEEDEPTPDFTKINVIKVKDPTLFKVTVILFEDDHYQISTYFDSYISSYPFGVLKEYERIKSQATEDALTHDTLLLSDYLINKSDRQYILADHLQAGTCLIYNKKSGDTIKVIQMEKIGSSAPLAGYAGRRFYINGTVFLEVIDLIS